MKTKCKSKTHDSKRLFDLMIGTILFEVSMVAILFIGILVRSKIGEPVIFKQKRAGLNGKPFVLYKFRTMTDGKDKQNNILPDIQRITPLGLFLRESSLDELPGFWNVLKGDMSIVGPRPLLIEYLCRYTKKQARRHDVKPGITGLAQVNGRNNISWEDKFKLDVWYIDHWSFRLDLKIIALTVLKIFRKEGINKPGCATVTEFKGSKNNDC